MPCGIIVVINTVKHTTSKREGLLGSDTIIYAFRSLTLSTNLYYYTHRLGVQMKRYVSGLRLPIFTTQMNCVFT